MNRSANCRKQGIAVVSAAWLLAVPVAWAVDEHHPDQNAGPAAAALPVSAKDTEQALQQLKQNADKLRAQMDKILKTKDPSERQKLMQEHMQTLRASMTTAAGVMGGRPGSGGMMGHGTMGGGMMDCPMMDQKMGGGMMDCPMMSGMMGGAGGGAANQAITDRLNQMEKRLDVMQMMLEDMRKK